MVEKIKWQGGKVARWQSGKVARWQSSALSSHFATLQPCNAATPGGFPC